MKVIVKAALLLAAVAVIMAYTYPVAFAAPPDLVEVANADTLRQEVVQPNSQLGTTLGGLALRIITSSANTLQRLTLVPPSVDFDRLLKQVVSHLLFGSVESSRQFALAPSGTLRTLLDLVGSHIDLRSAERNRLLTVQYPFDLLKDGVPPVIGAPSGKGALVQWTTNEFTSSIVRYGPHPNDLNQMLIDPTFQKAHKVQLSGMGPTTTLYCQITSADLSGNSSTGGIYQVSGVRYLYLPAVRR